MCSMERSIYFMCFLVRYREKFPVEQDTVKWDSAET
jgi:hypothetical protein